MLTRPRYEPGILPTEHAHAGEWSVLDTFTQEFCFKEYVGDKAGAIIAAGRLNAAYARAIAA